MQNMRVAMTDAAGQDFDQNFAVLDLKHWDILDLELLIDSSKNGGFEGFG